ncbi:glutathione synthetase [Lysinibacillus contaminans]|uniref:Glutathione biosynthesis bifunctional protein GshAB n=1 Tax=Lysinibacillus contaminans TaxID=1293441 RepID=A0ABR5K297_9BACI|nr:bifunctional glutamate--cysteine ligase GshA/glutathione synthetase GshB [Lysinibacillus contaminans]KOS68874.1 glutathione synthetase [Lysinibacillus contaminans]
MRCSLFSNLSNKQILDANFGIEREGLRVTSRGILSLTPHPEVFGDKKENPYITTDFSESQLEFVTPVFHNTSDAIDFLDSLYNIAALELDNEFIWPQSMPAVTPEDQDIPIATFSNHGKDERYRAYLEQKYGGKKQLISGIHINFSLGEKLIEALYSKSKKQISLHDFKQKLYLKLTRNYLRYHWLLVYFLGATNIIHKTYEQQCVEKLQEISGETYSNEKAISYRNSICGYQNKEFIRLDYSSIDHYVHSINSYIHKGVLEDIRELYSQIRLKSKGTPYSGENLLNNGIEYLEIRTIDINPFVKSGLSVEDLNFIHLFLLYCLEKDEPIYDDWQLESEQNSKKVAIEGQNLQLALLQNGSTTSLQSWGIDIIHELLEMNQQYGLPFTNLLKEKEELLTDYQKTYSYRLARLCKEKGFIKTHLELAKKHKKEAFLERFKLKPYTDMELSTQILLKESIKRGIHFHILDRKENFIELTKGENKQYIKQATKTSKDQYVAVLIMENKSVTKQILKRNNIVVPEGDEFFDITSAKESLGSWIGVPLVIKPKSTNFGLGISIFPNGAHEEDLIKGLEIAFSEDSTILIEPFIKGKEYRFLVIGDETVAVLHRVPANVTGDGTSTIQQLISQKNEDPLRGKGYKTPLEKIEIDENMKLFLQQKGLTIYTVLPKGECQYLRENSNISTGGDSIDVTDQVPEVFKQIAVEASQAVGAKICGVDMMIEDFEDEHSSYAIIELNFNPAIHIHSYPYQGTERNVAIKILELVELI